MIPIVSVRYFAGGFALLGLSAALAVFAPGAARGATIPFNEAIVFSTAPGASYVNTIGAAPVSESASDAGVWGSYAVSASANLASGQLKMRAAAAMGDGSAWPYVQSNAIFGDGMRVTAPGGGPFDWASAPARFTLGLDGSQTSSEPLDGQYYPAMFVILSVLQPGTLDPNAPLINGPTALDYFYWTIGNPSAEIYYTDQDGNHLLLEATENYDEIPATITAEFNPGGDFDWVLLVGASGQVTAPGQSFDFDLGHTVNVTFTGPDGGVTKTISGQFGNFEKAAEVTEPATLLLLVGALAGLAALRRPRLRLAA